ncbi:MAG TPA: D-glycerate dehydrogenase [Actinomycetota bacterium]|nr:D-glycerate dehydrogenase [Actinomycetota bacterium]
MSDPVLLTRRLDDEVMAWLRERVDLQVFEEDRPIPRDRLLRDVRGKAALLPLLTDRVDAEVLDAAGPQLKVVANYAVGYDNVDVEECTRRGIVVTNTPDVLTAATADLAWSLILAASRRIVEGDRWIRAGRPWAWAPGFMLGHEVTGRTLGVVGLGRIGQAVAARARGFDMPVIYSSRTRREDAERATGARYVDLDALTAEADVISIHVALTEGTRHLFDAARLKSMKETAVLVNTSRGPVVDEAALAEALETGEIFAAGLDVYEEEPKVHSKLLERENVVLAPHLGSATVETRRAMGMLAARNLVAVLRGERPETPLNYSDEK